ncbi:MAG: hypothetical protein ACI8PB_000870 [Desulforhopalus sp.]|jgi:hypothetical protein
MSSTIPNKRQVAFKKQSGRCYYCGSPMWEGKPKEFASKHKITPKYATRFQSTAEHLLARCDGGKDHETNIVAACLFCNSTRHKMRKPLSPPSYRSHIQNRLQQGKWHPQKL